ncbi:MAG: O-antigen ligase family protein [Clostridium sp.]|nr:O-antigen ligase family protein [Clostridium sp.]
MKGLKEKLKKANTVQLTKEQIINIILYMTIIVMPLIVTKKIEPKFLMTKLAFLYIACTLAFIVFIWNRKYDFKKEHIFAILFILSILISVIFSPFKKTALWGSFSRYEGFVSILIYVVLFIISSQYFKVNKKSINLLLIVGSIMGIYGVLQVLGIDPIQDWMFDGNITKVAYGTIGNRNFFSSYLILFLTLSTVLYIFKGEKKYLIYTILIYLGELCTLTRSGWIAYFICLVLLSFFAFKNKKIKRILILLIVLAITTIGINFISQNQVSGRIEHSKTEFSNKVESSRNSSTRERIDILRVCLNVFKDSPFLGTGPDTLGERLSKDYKNYVNEHVKLYGATIDKAHNEYLEYAVSCGIFTLIFYLILIFCILKGILKNIKDDKFKIILSVILSYLIQATLNISVIAVAPLFWILLGYAVKMIYEKNV